MEEQRLSYPIHAGMPRHGILIIGLGLTLGFVAFLAVYFGVVVANAGDEERALLIWVGVGSGVFLAGSDLFVLLMLKRKSLMVIDGSRFTWNGSEYRSSDLSGWRIGIDTKGGDQADILNQDGSKLCSIPLLRNEANDHFRIWCHRELGEPLVE